VGIDVAQGVQEEVQSRLSLQEASDNGEHFRSLLYQEETCETARRE
jgi:hypothetical protein